MFVRRFHTSSVSFTKVVPNNLKGKKKSSQEWLTRQLNDPFVERAKMANYRCRSAFKLLEIDQKYNIIKPGFTVIDCGAAPGSWSQIAVKQSNADGAAPGKPKGTVIGVDLLQIYPIAHATTLGNTDFTRTESQDKIRSLLGEKRIDCVLSDMAPNATGVRSLDQENIITLCYSVLRFAILMSSPNASLLMKVWDNGEVPALEKNIQRYYQQVKRIKPRASRADSAENFVLARGFVGVER
ncbi:ribosomal RNA large subunit methyltransferase J [Culex quinquefasciatus]|uniref:rRNA methyltransferase 2, mitochondrial n=1 Tax=Culex quinquefasciatus TaxID=7176 RepID=B0W330_CULQU|nr:ribosomal RNA large subunit methyltransferase J [Culex quinquefasciatus]|eukprot:XP_001843114.1 ribosomal RNA large subunit methyltransferase J [Culex quinquefasciatus]